MSGPWTEERRARQARTVALRRAALVRLTAVDAVAELLALGQAVEQLRARVAMLELRPSVVEWRPNHRRAVDGGVPVRAQRRDRGLPRRPRAIA